jgi:TolB-like protein
MLVTYSSVHSMTGQEFIRFFNQILCAVSALAVSILLSSCAYQLGVSGRTLPGGYKSVEVPMFINSSVEPGIEVAFTNSLIQEFEKNRVAAVQQPGTAPITVQGEIRSVVYKPTGPIQKGEKAPLLPDGTVLATGYRVIVSAEVSLIDKKTGTTLWRSQFDGESFYAAPQVTVARVNSVNPHYNLSARRRVIETIAADLMVEAHDRMTENF